MHIPVQEQYLHQEAAWAPVELASFFFKDLASKERPSLIAIGGGPASGKTTWRRRLQRELKGYFLHDMDEVMVRLPGYERDRTVFGGRIAFETWWPYARELSEVWVRSAIASKLPILYDRTCGAQSSYEDLLEAKRQGYFIHLIGLTVNRSVAYARAQKREQEEGRVMTEAIIDEYTRRFSSLWPLYLSFVDEAELYDTTEDPPKLIFSSKEGILDAARYQQFSEEADISF